MRSDAEEKSQGREGDDQLQGSAGPGFHLLALRWRDVDFERRIVRVHRTYKSGNGVDTPKSGRGRAVPMADEVAQALARLGEREHFTEDDDLVFRGPRGHVNAQKLGYRYKAALERAGLRELRFHDLRHTFGTIAINRADIVQVQAWMGHSDLKTTQRYLHYKARGDEAELLSGAFAGQDALIEPVRIQRRAA